jgi:hypothetical protein
MNSYTLLELELVNEYQLHVYVHFCLKCNLLSCAFSPLLQVHIWYAILTYSETVLAR